jgi:hypothetical protein
MTVIELAPYAPGRIVNWPPSGPPSDTNLAISIRRENAVSEARWLDDEELERRTSILAYHAAENTEWARACYWPVYNAFLAEITRRERLHAQGKVTGASDARTEALMQLRDEIKDRVLLVEVLMREYRRRAPITPGRKEIHCDCPACGGYDRFVVFTNETPQRFWCRRCEWFGDVIDLSAHLWGIDLQSAGGFRSVIERLAREYLGVTDD